MMIVMRKKRAINVAHMDLNAYSHRVIPRLVVRRENLTMCKRKVLIDHNDEG